MKRFMFFVVTAAMSIGVSAQVFTAKWERPAPTEFAEWEAEEKFYMYNVDGGGFYIAYQGGGPDEPPYWRTRSSVNDTIGAEVIFTRTNPDATYDEDWEYAPDNAYLMLSYVPKFSNFYCTFSEGKYNSVWTDNNRQYDHVWNVIIADDGSFRIEGSQDMRVTSTSFDYTGKYMGVWAADADKVLYLKDLNEMGEDAVFYDRWKLMTPAAYETYIATAKDQLARCAVADELRKTLEAAMEEYPALDFSSLIAVYNNLNSTFDELVSAKKKIKTIIVKSLVEGASVSNPADITGQISNPTFDGMIYTGWQGTAFSAGGDVDEVAEHFNKIFDTYQILDDMPAGVYEIRVNGFYRSGARPIDDYNALKNGTAKDAYLYISGETLGEFTSPIKHISATGLEFPLGLPDGALQTEYELITDDGSRWLPNTMVGANAYFHNPEAPGMYQSVIAAAISEGDALRFGVKKSSTVTDDWTVVDDFQLVYYGNDESAYDLIINNAIQTYNVETDKDGVFFGKPEFDSYIQAKADLKSASTIEQIKQSMPVLASARDLLNGSLTAYADYVTLVRSLEEWLMTSTGLQGDDYDRLSDYFMDVIEPGEEFPNGNLLYIIPSFAENRGEGKLSTIQIREEIEFLTNLKSAAIKNSLHDGSVLTDLVKNADFSNGGAGGWIADPQYRNDRGETGNITNWHGGAGINANAECFNHNFDVYQEIDNLANGLYEVSVQAFYRTAHNANAYSAWKYQTEDNKVLSEVYLNEFSQPVINVMDIQFPENLQNNCYMTDDGFYTLDGVNAAAAAFSSQDETQNFTQRVYGLVTDGKLRLGIRNTTGSLDGRWTLFDNFQLIFRAKNMEALNSVIDDYAERAEALEYYVYGNPEKNALMAAINSAKDASDSEGKYQALIKLVEAYNGALKCVDSYSALNLALDDFMVAILEAAVDNPGDVYNEAADYYDEVSEAYSNQDYNAAEAEAAVASIKQWIVKLRIPPYENASDQNPVDMTNVIENNSFDIVNDFTGWLGTQFGTGGDAGQNGEHYMKNYDSYQNLYGLPGGTYMLTVNGLYRHGNSQNDYKLWKAAKEAQAKDPDYVDTSLQAFLYASTSSKEVSVAIKHVCEGGKATPDFSSLNASDETSPCYVADSRTCADLYFHDEEAPGIFNHQVYITIQDNEVLRIGIKKNGEIPEAEWTVVDDFELFYYGKQSSHNDSSNPVAIEDVNANENRGNAYRFNLNGVRVGADYKGVVIENGIKYLVK